MPDNYKYNLNISQKNQSSPYTVDLLGAVQPKKKKKKVKKQVFTVYKNRGVDFLARMKAILGKLFIVALAVFLFRLVYKVFKAIHKACYALGWMIAFIARLFYFSFKALFLFIYKYFKYIEPLLLFFVKFVDKKVSQDKDQTGGQPQNSGMTVDYGRAGMSWGPAGFFSSISFKEIFNFKKAAGAVKETSKKAIPRPRKALARPAFFFAVFLFIAILPFKGVGLYNDLIDLKGRVLGVSEAAVSEMAFAADAAGNFNFETAGQSFERAGSSFLLAQKEIKDVSAILSVLSLIPSKNIRAASDASDILEAGKLSAELGVHISSALDSVAAEDKSLEKVVNSFYFHGQAMSDLSSRLETVLKRIDSENLPDEYRSRFEDLQKKSGLILNSLKELVDMIEKIRIFLGFDSDKRYLLVFQNNAELRASGGFVGSYALIDFSNGRIKNLEVPPGGSYDTEGGLLEKIAAPKPLWLLKPRWFFWDANWWPDWPTSARKLAWFYEKSGGPTVDGVISFTPDVVEGVLKVLGSLDMQDEYGLELNSENFRDITQIFSELKPDEQNRIIGLNEKIASSSQAAENIPEEKIEEYREEWAENNKPKKIIGDLFGCLIEDLPKKMDKEIFLSLLESASKNIKEKHILFYFNDQVLQEKTAELGWDGRVKEALQDYLMVVHTNIGGHKSDLKIEDEISHQVDISADGTVTDTLKITRKHTAAKGELFTGENNVDWLRVYVPKGARLIEAGGFKPPKESAYEYPEADWLKDPDLESSEKNGLTDVYSGTLMYEELDKTVFANWVQTKPGAVSEVYFKYELPFKVKIEEKEEGLPGFIGNLFNPGQKSLVPYSLLVQKQPGMGEINLKSELNASGKKIKWAYPDSLSVFGNAWQFEEGINTDIFFAAVMEE